MIILIFCHQGNGKDTIFYQVRLITLTSVKGSSYIFAQSKIIVLPSWLSFVYIYEHSMRQGATDALIPVQVYVQFINKHFQLFVHLWNIIQAINIPQTIGKLLLVGTQCHSLTHFKTLTHTSIHPSTHQPTQIYINSPFHRYTYIYIYLLKHTFIRLYVSLQSFHLQGFVGIPCKITKTLFPS